MVPSERTVFTMAISTKLMLVSSELTLTHGHKRRRLISSGYMVMEKDRVLVQILSFAESEDGVHELRADVWSTVVLDTGRVMEIIRYKSKTAPVY